MMLDDPNNTMFFCNRLKLVRISTNNNDKQVKRTVTVNSLKICRWTICKFCRQLRFSSGLFSEQFEPNHTLVTIKWFVVCVLHLIRELSITYRSEGVCFKAHVNRRTRSAKIMSSENNRDEFQRIPSSEKILCLNINNRDGWIKRCLEKWIHKGCNPLVDLLHLKLINTKHSYLQLQYSFETQKCQNRALYPFYQQRKQRSI